jgi:hypothetical protein
MSDEVAARLSSEEVMALKFAANRQLARWANKSRLSEHQHSQRAALRRAVRVLQEDKLAHGCDLLAPDARGAR